MSNTTTMPTSHDDSPKMTIVIKPDFESLDVQSYKSTGIRSQIVVYFSGETASGDGAPVSVTLDEQTTEAVQSILKCAVKDMGRFRCCGSDYRLGSSCDTLSKVDTERLSKDIQYFVKEHTMKRDPRFDVLVCSEPQTRFTDETLVPNTLRQVGGYKNVQSVSKKRAHHRAFTTNEGASV